MMGPIPELREGDVVRYEPPTTLRCDGQAIAHRLADGSLCLLETYWVRDGNVVSPATYEVLFNLDDYEEVPDYRWERFAPADRRVLRRQSSRYRTYYVRKGATESRDQIVANAREALVEAEREVETALSARAHRQRELDELLASADSWFAPAIPVAASTGEVRVRRARPDEPDTA